MQRATFLRAVRSSSSVRWPDAKALWLLMCVSLWGIACPPGTLLPASALLMRPSGW